jgi:hypothetical protein
MKRHRSKRRQQTIHVWTYEQARQAQPLVASILRSLRDQLLAVRTHERTAERLANRPGRPSRADLIAHEEATTAAGQARTRFQEVLHELHELDLYSLDPLGGGALIPVLHDNQLAWLVFELFAEDPLRYWRFHKDTLETRRPMAEMWAGQSGGGVIV